MGCLLLHLFLFYATIAHAKPFAEFKVKAAFLLKFVTFVEWPVKNTSLASAPIQVGIVGDDPFGPLLSAEVSPEEPNDFGFSIARIPNANFDVSKYRVLYLSSSDPDGIAALLERIREQPILTVGEGESFISQGGIIGFHLENNRVRFLVNLKAAQKANLKISSQLLNLASFVVR